MFALMRWERRTGWGVVGAGVVLEVLDLIFLKLEVFSKIVVGTVVMCLGSFNCSGCWGLG